MKTNVYVDGFNLYYGAVKGTPYKWLDIRKYCELAFPKATIHEIHYCTAIVKDAKWDPQQSTRQRAFIRALETTGVEVHYGSFQSKSSSRFRSSEPSSTYQSGSSTLTRSSPLS